MRHLFLAAVMTIGALVATSTAATLLQDRAMANRAKSNTAWQAPPPLPNQYPALKR